MSIVHQCLFSLFLGTHSMLSSEVLSREEQLAISCAKVLSAWCWSCDTSDKYQVTGDSAQGVNRTTVSQKLLEIFEGEVNIQH